MKAETKVSAKNKIMDYLAQRDHSEKELREKLARRYDPKQIEEALQSAKRSGLLRDPSELSRDVAKALARKKKSLRYIQAFLKKKGLPPVESKGEDEIEKARDLLQLKFRKTHFSFEEKPKALRYLIYRGFDHDTIRQAIENRSSDNFPRGDE